MFLTFQAIKWKSIQNVHKAKHILENLGCLFKICLLVLADWKRTLQSWSSFLCGIGDQRNVLLRSREVLLDCSGYLSKWDDTGILDEIQTIKCKMALYNQFGSLPFKY